MKNITKYLEAQNPLRYFKSAIWLTAARIGSMLISLAATFYIARSLGPKNFGEISYAQSIISILAILGAISQVLYRDVIKNPKDENRILGTAWALMLANAFLISALSLIYVLIVPHDKLTAWVLAILCIGQFFTPFSVIRNVFLAKTETKWLSIITLIIHVFLSVLKILIIAAGEGVLALAAIMALEHVISAMALVVLYTYTHKGKITKWFADSRYAKKLISDSFPMIIVSIGAILAARIDQVFLKNMLDISTVGLYSVAVQLSEVWQYLPGVIITAIFPAVINAKTYKNIYKKRIIFMISSFALYGIAISLVISTFAPYIITKIYGEEFYLSASILRVYIWSLTPMILGFVVSHILIAENFKLEQVISSLIPAFLNIILNIILIPKFGAIGAAWATLISYSLMPILPLLSKRVRQILLT